MHCYTIYLSETTFAKSMNIFHRSKHVHNKAEKRLAIKKQRKCSESPITKEKKDLEEKRLLVMMLLGAVTHRRGAYTTCTEENE